VRQTRVRRHVANPFGFTLVELLVVVLIVGLLVGIVGPRLFGQVSKSEITTARAQIDAFDKALQAYRLDMGRYPSTDEGLAVLTSAPADSAQRWRGPYLQAAVPTDPWGVSYRYRAPGNNGRDYELLSFGPDRRQGGTGDDADIGR
jgi:general secretion pathway protein G